MIKLHKRIRPLLGTFVEISISCDDNEVFQNAFSKIKKIHDLLSLHRPDSELSQLNSSLNTKKLLSVESVDILKKSLDLMKKSQSLFDITIGGMLQKKNVIPTHPGQENRLDFGEIEDIELGEGGCLLRRPITLTLDGIAKGFAVDLAHQALIDSGVEHGLINAGGDIRIFGNIQVPIYRREINLEYRLLGHFEETCLASSRSSILKDENFPGLVISKEINTFEEKIWTIAAKDTWKADALTKVAILASSFERNSIITSLGGEVVLG
jgi:thiamine biosynthesis lipoprotein